MSSKPKRTEPKANDSVNVENISIGGSVGGFVLVGSGNVVGYTPEQVSNLLEQISKTFQPKPFNGICPYKGLDYFEEEDADIFFGREKLVDDLVSRVKESRTLFITGPSGSGKSSLVRAGLVHTLKQDIINGSGHWLYETLKPGRDPFEALAFAFSRLKSPDLAKYFREHAVEEGVLQECAESVLSSRKDQRLVLFIDQFEEVFTQLSRDKTDAFITLLTNVAAVEDGRVTLLFAMRSDFVSNCATYPELNALLNRQFIQIGAMQAEELVSAIAQPALRVGLRIDPDLIAQIINDMKGEPGALPLMQFVLKDLFDEGQSKSGLTALTLDAYFRHGGIQKSLERHADAVFGKLEMHEQELARSIFSGLIEIGHGTQDTKRTALFDELIPAGSSVDDVETIVQKLADARLITTDEVEGNDTVTISHEKLIDAWPWLRKLVNENRDIIALQNEIVDDAKAWEDHNRDASYLYTGGRLSNIQEQLKSQKINLGSSAHEFIRTSLSRQRRNQRTRISSLATVGLMLFLIISMGIPLILEEIAKSKAQGEMILIPAGEVIIGTNNPDLLSFGLMPSQQISFAAFQIGKYEVTNSQYQLCVRFGDCTVPHDQTDFRDVSKQDHPIVSIILLQANQYCRWLGQRLPKQAEWERVARGPNGNSWPWGEEEPTPDKVNMPIGSHLPGGLVSVYSYPNGATPEGVYHLIGNAWEWTSSYFDIDGNSSYAPQNFWDGSDETYIGTRSYIVEGGGWLYPIGDVAQFNPTGSGVYASADVGFRCAADAQ